MRLISSVTIGLNDIKHLIDWDPDMRLWPEPGFLVIDTIEGIKGGERFDSENLEFALTYIIKLTEECAQADTDSRIDN